MIVEIDEFVGDHKVGTVSINFGSKESLRTMITITNVCIDLLNWSLEYKHLGNLHITSADRI